MHDDISLRKTLELLIDGICERATNLQIDGSLYEEIGPLVSDHSFDAPSAEAILSGNTRPEFSNVLDFGCGQMAHKEFIEKLGFKWHGVDRLDSVSKTVREKVAQLSDTMSFYDGVELPYKNNSFDIVWAMLTLQHVQNIDSSFGEIARVLRPGGKLIAQVSYLEQVQDYMTFGFTPIGLKTAGGLHGLVLKAVYPKHDSFSFLVRRLYITLGSTDNTPFNDMMNPDGYFYEKMMQVGGRLSASIKMINLLKIIFSSHLVCEWERVGE